MKNALKNFAIAFSVFTLVIIVGTCQVNKTEKPETIPIDTLLINSYKQKVNELQTEYENQIDAIRKTKDSLQNLVLSNKKTIRVLNGQSKLLEIQIKNELQNSDSTFVKDSLKIKTLEYITIQNERDSICNGSINTLELIASKQDSILMFKDKQNNNLKDLLKQNELREQYLTEQLNTAFKHQRKILLKNKLCAGALILLSGFTTAILINQTLK